MCSISQNLLGEGKYTLQSVKANFSKDFMVRFVVLDAENGVKFCHGYAAVLISTCRFFLTFLNFFFVFFCLKKKEKQLLIGT